jgi:hypothetical protein
VSNQILGGFIYDYRFKPINNPFLNKGTAFTKEERAKYGITGMLPSTVQTLEQQAVQAYGQYLSKPSDLEKRIFLMNIFNTNRTLFYKLMGQHIVEFMPIVYDPVVRIPSNNTTKSSLNHKTLLSYQSMIQKASKTA